MAEKKIHLQIIMPEEKKVDEEADMVILRCTTGDMGILPGHEELSSVLDYGIVRILNDSDERSLAVYGGLVTIQNDQVTVLTSEAEWPEEVDYARANADRKHIEQRLREKTDDLEVQNDLILLRRALVQMEVSSLATDEEDEEESS